MLTTAIADNAVCSCCIMS